MTPKEKAKELVENYAETINPIEFGIILERDWKSAKQCALIAVDEILNYENQLLKNYKFKIENSFYEQVKQEIEKL